MDQPSLPLDGIVDVASPRREEETAPVRAARRMLKQAIQLALDFTRATPPPAPPRLASGGNEGPLVYLDMPRTRADCRGPGICPVFRCRHNLALRVKDSGAIKVDGGGPGTTLRPRAAAGPRKVERLVDAIVAKADRLGTLCSLDIAEAGARSIPEVAELLGVTEEVVRQIFLDATHELQIAEARERRAEQRQFAHPKQPAPLVQIRRRP